MFKLSAKSITEWISVYTKDYLFRDFPKPYAYACVVARRGICIVFVIVANLRSDESFAQTSLTTNYIID